MRMSKHTEAEEESVSADLRKERIDADGDVGGADTR